MYEYFEGFAATLEELGVGENEMLREVSICGACGTERSEGEAGRGVADRGVQWVGF